MSTFKLLSPAAAGVLLDRLSKKALDRKFTISVHEDKCFAERRLELGEISLPLGDAEFAVLDGADRSGCYEWRLPTEEEVLTSMIASLGIPAAEANGNNRNRDKEISKAERALDLIAGMAARLGLIQPIFDADSLAEFPFKRPVTIVTDTAAIAQGALDFVARYLHPAARIKIPAIAHMEIVNQGDRYFAQRRSLKSKATALYEHMLSQGSQRTLLRLELHSDVEIERTAVMSEPLRSAFQKETGGEVGDLNLSAPVRSFCDRLILEVARQHQSYSAPGHGVYLLTADQGLARMAMSEGIEPIFYASPVARDFLGTTVTGAGFNPLTGALNIVPLTDLLWELAVTFGNARISLPDGSAYVEVATIGEGLTWSPFHSRDDLFWVRMEGEGDSPVVALPVVPTEPAPATKTIASGDESAFSASQGVPSNRGLGDVSMIRFSAERLFDVVSVLVSKQSIPLKVICSQTDLSEKAWPDYQKFLESGQFIVTDKKAVSATDRLAMMWQACVSGDHETMTHLLKGIPSFGRFCDVLGQHRRISAEDTLFPSRVLSGYQVLAEFCCVGAPISGEGFYATMKMPTVREFADIAVKQFERVANGEKLASVGAWLEELIRSDGIHPLNTRSLLAEARAAKLVQLVIEGSTTDTRHDRKAVRTLVIERGMPVVKMEYLYRGDFLVPGKSSTSFRLEGVAK